MNKTGQLPPRPWDSGGDTFVRIEDCGKPIRVEIEGVAFYLDAVDALEIANKISTTVEVYMRQRNG